MVVIFHLEWCILHFLTLLPLQNLTITISLQYEHKVHAKDKWENDFWTAALEQLYNYKNSLSSWYILEFAFKFAEYPKLEQCWSKHIFTIRNCKYTNIYIETFNQRSFHTIPMHSQLSFMLLQIGLDFAESVALNRLRLML